MYGDVIKSCDSLESLIISSNLTFPLSKEFVNVIASKIEVKLKSLEIVYQDFNLGEVDPNSAKMNPEILE